MNAGSHTARMHQYPARHATPLYADQHRQQFDRGSNGNGIDGAIGPIIPLSGKTDLRRCCASQGSLLISIGHRRSQGARKFGTKHCDSIHVFRQTSMT